MDSAFTETTIFIFTFMVYIIVKYETAVASAVGKKAFLVNRINHWEGMECVSVLERSIHHGHQAKCFQRVKSTGLSAEFSGGWLKNFYFNSNLVRKSTN